MANPTARTRLGIELANGTRITHGTGANVKTPLPYSPVVMHELYTGAADNPPVSYEGQFGFIPFNTQNRLPRHVHMARDKDSGALRLLPERILVLHGVGITELCGEYYVIAPGTLVDIPPGVPHTWNACPAGIALPDGTVSDGTFTMVYSYSEVTSFYATRQTEILRDGAEYQAFEGDPEEIRFPVMTREEVTERCQLVWNEEVLTSLTLA